LVIHVRPEAVSGQSREEGPEQKLGMNPMHRGMMTIIQIELDFRRGERTRRSCSQLIRDRRDLAAPLMNGPACRVSVHIAWPAPCDSDTQHDRLIYGDPMDKTEAESRVLQSDASGDAHAVSAPVQTIDSAGQLELDFRASVLQMVLPDQETLEFWRATADNPQEFAGRIAKFSRQMQRCASASTRVTKNKSKP